jgi:hypothetical protein
MIYTCFQIASLLLLIMRKKTAVRAAISMRGCFTKLATQFWCGDFGPDWIDLNLLM